MCDVLKSQLSVAAAATQLLTQLAVSCYQEAILLPDVDILSEAMQVGQLIVVHRSPHFAMS